MNERRLLPRWEIKKEAKVVMSYSRAVNLCIVEDMHLQGMRVSFNKRLPQEYTLRMSFAIGESYDFINIEAQIRWMREEQGRFVYGLMFSKIDKECIEKMYRYITTHCEEQFSTNRWA